MKHETNSFGPPRLAVWLFQLFVPNLESESPLGDLLEEYPEIASRSGIASARSWFWRQTIKTLPHLLIQGFQAAPWSTVAAVLGGFLLMRLVSRLPEMAVFAVLSKYRVFEHHFQAYAFFASTGIALAHVIVSGLVGLVVALVSKKREMVATLTLALIFCAMIVTSYIAWIAQQWPMSEAFSWMLWQFTEPLAIVVAGAIVRSRRSSAILRSTT